MKLIHWCPWFTWEWRIEATTFCFIAWFTQSICLEDVIPLLPLVQVHTFADQHSDVISHDCTNWHWEQAYFFWPPFGNTVNFSKAPAASRLKGANNLESVAVSSLVVPMCILGCYAYCTFTLVHCNTPLSRWLAAVKKLYALALSLSSGCLWAIADSCGCWHFFWFSLPCMEDLQVDRVVWAYNFPSTNLWLALLILFPENTWCMCVILPWYMHVFQTFRSLHDVQCCISQC